MAKVGNNRGPRGGELTWSLTCAFLGTATGKTLLKRLVFENNREGFEKLLMHVESISASNGHKRVTFGLEPTADYHKPLAEFLINREHNLVLVSGVAVKRNRELLDGRWDLSAARQARMT